MDENVSTEQFISKLFGFDLEAERKKRSQEFSDYAHLLATMTPQEIYSQIGVVYADDVKKAAILLIIAAKVFEPQK